MVAAGEERCGAWEGIFFDDRLGEEYEILVS